MAKKTGLIFIVYFLLQLVAAIVFSDSWPGWLVGFSYISFAILFPFSFSLLVLNSEDAFRDKIKKYYLIFSIVLITAGLTSRQFLLPGTNVEIIIAVLFYCFAFAPLELKSKYIKWKPFSNSIYEILMLSVATFVGINTLVIGLLFKWMHWPGSTILLVLGTIVCLVSIFSWNHKFKKEVVTRKESEDKIREQFTLIQDSINYAKRIQVAKLPRQEDIDALLPDSFVLFKPKDVVSGDFYYINKKEGKTFIAAADCTGHGVPGALMSMISYEKLDDAIRCTTDTSEILALVNKGIKTSLRQTESRDSTRDGMDIALCSIGGDTGSVKYAGANRPIWIIRKDSAAIEEIKATKRSIGGFTSDNQHFDTHTIQLRPGDTFYIFSDGYADSFSEEDQKLTTARFKEALLTVRGKSMKEQSQYLDSFIQNWVGKMEQIDDILVIGVRV